MARASFRGIPFHYQNAALAFCKKVEKRNEAEFDSLKMCLTAIQVAAIAVGMFTIFLLLPPVACLKAILLSALSTFALYKVYSLGKKLIEADHEVKKGEVEQMKQVAHLLELEAVKA